jgi:hypothetical protein
LCGEKSTASSDASGSPAGCMSIATYGADAAKSMMLIPPARRTRRAIS